MMATGTTSPHNPIYNEIATPGTTHPSHTSSIPPRNSAAALSSPADFLGEEPPAYTPTPDVHAGEATVEYGPRRPFQPAPVTLPYGRPPTLPLRPPPSETSSLSQSLNSSSLWRQLTQQISSHLTGSSAPDHSMNRPNWAVYPSPPPQQPVLQNSVPLQFPQRPASVTPPTAMSDFTRDFYVAGSDMSQSTTFPPSENILTGPQQPSSPPLAIPTISPTPGHPLLKDGKLLVYPKGFICEKCNNIGYKHADPSHPCRQCWSKYAKPFQGPLRVAFSPNTPFQGNEQAVFQSPLPALHPPRPGPSISPIAPPLPPRPASISFPPSQQRQGYFAFGPPPPSTNIQTLSPYQPRPANAVVYSAGDPRIGGRLCWRCEGAGSVTFLIFDQMTCEVCGGIGRLLS